MRQSGFFNLEEGMDSKGTDINYLKTLATADYPNQKMGKKQLDIWKTKSSLFRKILRRKADISTLSLNTIEELLQTTIESIEGPADMQ